MSPPPVSQLIEQEARWLREDLCEHEPDGEHCNTCTVSALTRIAEAAARRMYYQVMEWEFEGPPDADPRVENEISKVVQAVIGAEDVEK